MPRRRRAPYKCQWCKNPFSTPQAMWGHFPQCPVRKLSLKPAAEAGPEAPPSRADRESRRPGPDSQENRLCLLETHEQIQQLQQDALHSADMARILAGMNAPGIKYEEADEWLQLSHSLTDVERDSDQMLGRLRLDRSLLWRIYYQMRAIRDTWMEYRIRHWNHSPEGEHKCQEVFTRETARWEPIMTNIKKLLVASR